MTRLQTLLLLAMLAAAPNCLPVKCPLGTYPVHVSQGMVTGSDGSVSVPTASGSAGFKTDATSAYSCKSQCPKGTYPEACNGGFRCIPLKENHGP